MVGATVAVAAPFLWLSTSKIYLIYKKELLDEQFFFVRRLRSVLGDCLKGRGSAP